MNAIKKYFPTWVGIFVFVVIIVLFATMGYAPFGGNSLARSDANVQYLDFFAYLREILSGNATVGYTFDKVLGGNNIGIISYYLLSPFNILVLLFDKADLHSFIDITVALKLGLAACTMSFFLKQRFIKRGQNVSIQKYIFIGLFGISYALSQWFISQSSNTMWLDGAYMLPLILLGVLRLVQHRKIWLLSITTGLSIIFNWYSGGINCLFSFIWLLFELYNHHAATEPKINWKYTRNVILRYIISMLLALAISAITFLPTIEVMSGTNRGQLEINSLFDPAFRSNFISSIQTYSLGSVSSKSSVSLFCGSLTLLGVLGCLITKCFDLHKKRSYAVLLIVLLLLFYWNPGFMLFSLLKNADSFWYRYAYVAIFAIIFMAADFFINGNYQQIKKKAFLYVALSYSVIILLLNYINPELTNLQYAYYSIIFFSSITFLITTTMRSKLKFAILIIAVISELICSTIIQMKKFHTEDVYAYKNYSQLTEQQINEIKLRDDSDYRINQTSTRNHTTDNLTANYNEPLAYNYRSITGYTSNPDETQMIFLDKVGYLTGSVNMNIVDTSLLGIDSFLGVKYILSTYHINGLQETTIQSGYGEKKVYQNPYSFPLAFKYQNNSRDLETESWTGMNSINPFEYQNRILKKISNTDTEIYKPINSKVIRKNNEIIYDLNIPRGEYAVYANIPWQSPIPSQINLNNVYQLGYAMWLSPSALYVPTNPGDTHATVSIQTSDPDIFQPDEEQFYVLDLNALQKISNTARTNEPETIIIKDGYAYFEIDATSNESLFTSIPKDKNWTIKLNGQEIKTEELFADTFYSIPLQPGHNKIEMTYKLKSQIPGIVITFISLAILAGLSIFNFFQKKHHLVS